jgi:hypothetical protein
LQNGPTVNAEVLPLDKSIMRSRFQLVISGLGSISFREGRMCPISEPVSPSDVSARACAIATSSVCENVFWIADPRPLPSTKLAAFNAFADHYRRKTSSSKRMWNSSNGSCKRLNIP